MKSTATISKENPLVENNKLKTPRGQKWDVSKRILIIHKVLKVRSKAYLHFVLMMTKLIQNSSKIRQILGAAKRSLNNFKDILGTDFLIKKFPRNLSSWRNERKKCAMQQICFFLTPLNLCAFKSRMLYRARLKNINLNIMCIINDFAITTSFIIIKAKFTIIHCWVIWVKFIHALWLCNTLAASGSRSMARAA